MGWPASTSASHFEPKQAVYDAARRIAEARGLPEDWLNDAVKRFLPGPDPNALVYFDRPGLVVRIALARYLLAMKLLASSGKQEGGRLSAVGGGPYAGQVVEANGGDEEISSKTRPSFADRPLDGDERERLLALRAATGENAALHVAVLAALAEAAHAYRLQLRTSEIRSRLDGTEHLEVDERAVRASLDQLREWRCVDWVQDPSIRARSIEEYVRRHELWELTPIGSSTLQAIGSVLGASDEAGSLQRTMFRQVRTSLDQLAAAVAQRDAAGVYLHLRDLDLALGQLAENAREFYATINRIAREERLEDHVFLLYKDQLIAYLQSFHDDLVRNRALIAVRLSEMDAEHRSSLLALAAEGDDSVGVFGPGSDWEQRWDGMLDWFVPGRAARSEVDALAGATTVAIRELLTLLRRLTEQATRPVNRASELREMSAWFARCESDGAAHTLFDAAFGLSSIDHLGLAVPDLESDGPFASWWDIDPVDVPMSLRAYGRRPARGATAKRRDYSAAKAMIEAERAAEAARLADERPPRRPPATPPAARAPTSRQSAAAITAAHRSG